MKNYVNSGDIVTIAAPAAITSGAFVTIGRLFGFAQTDAAEGDAVAIVTRGVFTASVADADGIASGDAIYATSAGALTTTASGNTYIGCAVTAGTSSGGSATVNIRLS